MALNYFQALVNASSSTPNSLPLSYAFSLVGFVRMPSLRGCTYLLAFPLGGSFDFPCSLVSCLMHSLDSCSYPLEDWVYNVAGPEIGLFEANFSAASTRSFFLKVAVTNAFGSSTACVVSTNTSSGTEVIVPAGTVACPVVDVAHAAPGLDDVLQEIFDLLNASAVETTSDVGSAFIAGLDVISANATENSSSTDDFVALFETFEEYLNTTNGDPHTDVDVLVLQLFVDYVISGTGTTNVPIDDGADGNLLAVVEAVGEGVAQHSGDESTFSAFLDVLNTIVTATDVELTVAALDDSAGLVCAGSESDKLPSGDVTTFVESLFSVECSAVESFDDTYVHGS